LPGFPSPSSSARTWFTQSLRLKSGPLNASIDSDNDVSKSRPSLIFLVQCPQNIKGDQGLESLLLIDLEGKRSVGQVFCLSFRNISSLFFFYLLFLILHQVLTFAGDTLRSCLIVYRTSKIVIKTT
jgi:hypothetical protein